MKYLVAFVVGMALAEIVVISCVEIIAYKQTQFERNRADIMTTALNAAAKTAAACTK